MAPFLRGGNFWMVLTPLVNNNSIFKILNYAYFMEIRVDKI